MTKTICWIQHTQKRIEAEKCGDKDGKVLYKLMNNGVYGKTMKTLINIVDVKLASNKKGYLKWISTFDNDLVTIRKNKVTSNLTKLHALECAY